MNILEINRFSILFQQPLYIILFFSSSSSTTTTLFKFIFKREREKKSEKKPTEIHNGTLVHDFFKVSKIKQ